MHFETKALHGPGKPDKAYNAVSVPVYQTSTFIYDDIGRSRGYSYSRASNPTRQALEDTLALLEGGKAGFAFASGMAAESAVAHLLKAGEHVLCVADPYGGTYRLFKDIMPAFGINTSFIRMDSPQGIEGAIRPDTRLLWLESPTNPLLNIVDLEMAAAVARKHKLISVIDNTFATPYFQRPIELGIHIVVHSLTKYLGGHSDVIGGAVIVATPELAERVHHIQIGLGGIAQPWDSWLVLRGLETLAVRMDRHQANAQAVAELLQRHTAVSRVLYPGLPDHPGHEIARKQMSGFGGMLSFELFALADSLGGTHSLAESAVLQSHASMDKAYRDKIGITGGMIRLSVGLEYIDDLRADLTQALA
jgi:cystathionine beta-lyase/cystathionine gamma-synthase